MDAVSLWELLPGLTAGGICLVAVLACLSLATLTMIAGRQIAMVRASTGQTTKAERAVSLFRRGQIQRARTQLRDDRSGAGQALALILTKHDEGDFSRPQIEEAIVGFVTDRHHSHATGLPFLDFAVRAAPVLGLAGPFIGMWDVLRWLLAAEGAASASILLGSLWFALFTLSVGAIVSLGALKALNAFEERLESERRAIERTTADLLSLLEERQALETKSGLEAEAAQSLAQTPPVRLVARQSDAQQMRVERKTPRPDTRTAKALEQRRHALAA